MIGGDPESLRLLARRVRDLSGEIDDAGGQVRTTSGVTWHSTAADSFRTALEERAAGFTEVGGRYEALAAAIDHLASTLEARQRFLLDAFHRAEHAFESAVDDAVDGVEEGAEKVWDYAGDVAGFAKDKLGWLS